MLETLRSGELLQIEGIRGSLETQLTSSEVFTALFELERAGRIRQLPGKNYVRTLGERNRSESTESERLYVVFV